MERGFPWPCPYRLRLADDRLDGRLKLGLDFGLLHVTAASGAIDARG